MEAGTGMVDDLASLSDLTEKSLLNELYVRYNRDNIYTYIGDVLVAVNPLRDIPGLYDEQHTTLYKKVVVRSKLRPHIFAVADSAYQGMLLNKATQCCVVSGESGAGKTESTKLLVKHIVDLCPVTAESSNDLHCKLVEVNPLLEAFGNAQTTMNDNSSRFGKYIELKFTDIGTIVGGCINIFLLEKTRVISHGLEEKNFHIFYHLFAGLTENQLRNVLLTSPEIHRILKPRAGGPVFKSKTQHSYHRQKFNELVKIMSDVGFSTEEMESIYAVLAAVLHMSDIQFENDSDTDGVYIVNEYPLEIGAELLGVSAEDLATTLISNTSIIRGEKIVSLKNLHQANDCRDAVSKSLYSRLFGWIVRQINNKLKPSEQQRNVNMSTIGILDIAGFENVKHNSFEQLCINVSNEQLQFYFNQHIFTWEMNDLEKEGIKGTHVKFTNNANILNMFFEKPIGLYALLDEESKFPKATSSSLLEKFKKHLSKHHLKKEKGRDPLFSIQHYAGPVVYNAAAMLEKNRDSLSSNALDCLQRSESGLVYELFTSQFTITGDLDIRNSAHPRKRSILMCKQPSLDRGKSLSRDAGKKVRANMKKVLKEMQEDLSFYKHVTAGNQFMASLTELTRKLMAGQPHFIRCIKPNRERIIGNFESDFVRQQLKYTGILETVRIRHEGFPVRLPFHEFIDRYKFISYPLSSFVPPDATHCQAIVSQTRLHQWEIGKNKVFLKYWHTEQLSSVLHQKINQVIKVQKVVRGFVARRKTDRVRQIVAAKKQAQVRSLLQSITNYCDQMAGHLKVCADHDINRWQEKLAATAAEEERLKKQLIEQKRIKVKQLQAERERKLEDLRNQEAEVKAQIRRSRELHASRQKSSASEQQKTKESEPISIVEQNREPAGTWRSQHVNKKEHVTGLKDFLENHAAEELKTAVPPAGKTDFRWMPDDEKDDEYMANPNVQAKLALWESYASRPVSPNMRRFSYFRNSKKSLSTIWVTSPLARRRIVSDPPAFEDIKIHSGPQREYEYENNSHYARRPAALGSIFKQKTKAEHYEDLIEEALDSRTADPKSWGKLVYMEKSYRCLNQTLKEPLVIVDGAKSLLDDSHVAIGAVDNPFRDKKVVKIREHVGKGLALKIDGDGSIWATRLGINDIAIQDYRNPDTSCVAEGVCLPDGRLELGVPVKVFDMKEFKSHVILEMHSAGVSRMDIRKLCKCTILSMSFVKQADDPMATPCWINIVNSFAMKLLHDEKAVKGLEKDMQKIMRSNIDFSKISQLPSFAKTTVLYKPAQRQKKQKLSRQDHHMTEVLYESPGRKSPPHSNGAPGARFSRQLSRPWAKLHHK